MDGRALTIGSHAYFEADFPHGQPLHDWALEREQSGQTTMMLAQDRTVMGGLALADTLRDETPGLIRELAAFGIPTVMLTGDHQQAADNLASQANITHVRAGLLPEHKVDAVRELQAQFGAVGMVGDGSRAGRCRGGPCRPLRAGTERSHGQSGAVSR